MLNCVKNLVAVLLFCSSYWVCACAQLAATAHMPHGVEVSNSQLTLCVDALRDDVLRVRVFPVGNPASYDFRNGAYLRLHVTCSVAADGALTVNIPLGEGSYKSWWSSIEIEAVGFEPKEFDALVGKNSMKLVQSKLGWTATFDSNDKAQTIVLR